VCRYIVKILEHIIDRRVCVDTVSKLYNIYRLGVANTCNVTADRNTVTLQMTDTIRS
jgi:hypothetical protein